MSSRATLAVAILLVGLALVPGCAEDGAPSDAGDGDGSRTYERCDTTSLSREINGTTWHVARVSCEANVTGTNSHAIPCGQPGEAELTASTELTDGEVEVTVDDGDQRLAEHRLADTGGEARELAIDEGGQAGEWTLAVERLASYEGSYQAELACPE